MTDNIRSIPNEERDEMQAALEYLKRTMPAQAELAFAMLTDLQKAGFTEDQALKLVAYSLFHED